MQYWVHFFGSAHWSGVEIVSGAGNDLPKTGQLIGTFLLMSFADPIRYWTTCSHDLARQNQSTMDLVNCEPTRSVVKAEARCPLSMAYGTSDCNANISLSLSYLRYTFSLIEKSNRYLVCTFCETASAH